MIRREYLLIAGALLLVAGGCASQPFTVVYEGKGVDRGVGLLRVSDGGYLVTGVTSSFDSGVENGLVIRLDDEGRAEWIEALEGNRDAAAWAAVETDLGFAVVGFSGGQNEAPDCTLTYLDRDGSMRWVRSYGDAGRERCWGLLSLGDDGFALVGEVVTDTGVNDCLLIRVDEDGHQLWTRTYDNGQQERCFGIAPMPGGGMMLAGQTSTDGGEERDVYLVGTDGVGEVLFEHVLGKAGIDLAHGAVSTDHGVIVVGYSATFGVDDVDPLLLKVTPDGEIAWTKPLPVPGHARGLSVDAASNGDLCIGGYRLTAEGTVPIVIRTTPAGREIWTRELEEFSIGYTAVADRDGGCVITGHRNDDGNLDLVVARVTSKGETSPDISVWPVTPDSVPN